MFIKGIKGENISIIVHKVSCRVARRLALLEQYFAGRYNRRAVCSSGEENGHSSSGVALDSRWQGIGARAGGTDQ
jgi:hypothetical protein